ncbi:DNA repair helicase [Stagonosporopsis vannaccii]|nr:DNA repair helicase [Stagonosporopsis vannaccii]
MPNDSNTRDFHHPYEPYDIQEQFMNAVYDCLEDGKVGIFESPTGTGKSLSLICGSLTWLRDHKRRTFEEGFQVEPKDSDDPPWMLEHARDQRKQEAFQRRQELNQRLAKIKAKEKRAKERATIGSQTNKRQRLGSDDAKTEDAEAHFALDDYESDQENASNAKTGRFDSSGLSAETQALMDKLGFAVRETKAEDGMVPDETKIFFCSRTHSQLTQFSSELSRVRMPPAIIMEEGVPESGIGRLTEDVKYMTLGSRKNLCINPKVSRLGSATAINERCLELQQSGSNECRCPSMPTKDNEGLLNDFRDYALAKIRDIEDLGALGKKLGVCPYYASRSATKFCEIVTLPYPLLLQRSAREALGLSLKDHIVVIDEAHNLMDAIAGIHSVSVTLSQVQRARSQLTVYVQKFRNRLKGKNRVYVAQVIRILDSIISHLQSNNADPQVTDGLVDRVSIMSSKGVEQINIFKLNIYLQESKLARKVDGYTAFTDEASQGTSFSLRRDEPVKAARHTVPVLMHVQSFLLSLMNPSAEGRFFYSKEGDGEITLRYMLLDPTYHFQDIVEDARAVLLAGGTMSPMSDYEQHLFPYLQPGKIQTLSCGHVVPPSNLLAAPITKASSGVEFDFTFEGRNKESTILNLGQAMLRMSGSIPDGVVVFFPSYAYLDTCIASWRHLSAQPSGPSIWERLAQIKPLFLEQRGNSQSASRSAESKEAAVDTVLTAYSAAVASGNGRGALLFAVIGGSLSEGINFSDALGRGVIVVGLPFPNPHSAEWKAKLQYITSKENARGGDGKAAAREFFENTCMRAVNQCVGRAIRHRGDYAAILMLDKSVTETRLFWIDSICIDQTPEAVEERNVQVALMGDIYKSAARVVVWLGSSNEHVERALRQVMDIAMVTRSAPQSIANRRLVQQRLHEYTRNLQDSVRSASEDPLGPLFECSWFYRMWTVQEVTLSAIQKTFVRCGSTEIPWPVLVIAVDALKAVRYRWGRWQEATNLQKQLTTYVTMRRIPGSKAILDDNPGNLHNDPLVMSILASTRKKLAGNEKDKVIALYGLFMELEIPFPTPDYTIPVEEIYRQATAAAMKYDKSLHVLYHAPSDKRRKSLASWVPDWADSGFDQRDGRYGVLRDRFSASGPGHPLFHFSQNETVLILRGTIIDTVIFKTEPLPDSTAFVLKSRAGTPPANLRETFMQNSRNTVATLRSWVDISKWTDYPTGESSQDALRRTLVQDNPEENVRYSSDGTFDAWYDNMNLSDIELVAKGMVNLSLGSQLQNDVNLAELKSFALFSQNPFHTFTTVMCSRKCFFYTEKNYFGTAPDPLPDSMQAGDVIALISGLEMPMLLRRVEAGYRLISHIYVHGIMYGELWPENNNLIDTPLV